MIPKNLEPRLSVLVVEDEKTYSRMAIEMLEGCQRHLASTAAEGLALFAKHKPNITFLDIGLPDKSGLTVLRQIKGKNPEAFVVMFTASRISDDVEAARLRGAAGYVAKPFNRHALRRYLDVYRDYRKQMEGLSPESRIELYQEYFRKAQTLNEQPMPISNETIAEQRRLDILSSWHILYADSNRSNGNNVRNHLQKFGCSIDVVHSAQSVTESLKNKPYGLLCIDNHLSDEEGVSLIRTLRHEGYNMPVIAMLTDAGERSDTRWNPIDIAAFVCRPFKIKTLLQAIEHELEKYIELLTERNTG